MYESKKALLIAIGKNPEDRKLVDRMIQRWEVYVEDGMYGLRGGRGDSEPNSMNFEQTAKILELSSEVEKLREENEWLKRLLNSSSNENSESLKSDLDFQISENERLEAKVAMYQEAIRNCYRWAVEVKKDKTNRPDFKKWVLKLGEDLPGEDNQ